MNKQLLDYIQQSLEKGCAVEQIRVALVKQGWSENEINEAITKAQEAISQKLLTQSLPLAPRKKAEWELSLKNISASQILLYLGALVVVLAGVIYVGIGWSHWGAIPRILAIFVPMVICFGTGVALWPAEHQKKQSLVFLVVGALLFPLFLVVALKELQVFSEPFSIGFCLTVSSLALLLYLGLNVIFRSPVWAFLYHLVFLFAYYFFLRIMGFESIAESGVIAWLFLIPATAYVGGSIWYEKRGETEAGYYSYVFGVFAILFAFIRLLQEMPNSAVWLVAFLLAGIAYFGMGMLYEKNGYYKYCQGLYLLGAGVVFFALLRAGFYGTVLIGAMGIVSVESEKVIGWSNVILGVLYLFLAVSMGELKKLRFHEAARYAEFFEGVGCFWFLGALHYLGLGGREPVDETLVLLGSLGFIFLSVLRISRQFLYIGTMSLIIYIFSIGGEYFENSVGWPLTLFVAGLASMAVGVGIEKMRRRYFSTKP